MIESSLIITRREQKILSLLIRENRLVQATAYEENKEILGNIYIGKIKNIVVNIKAAFVEIENGQMCFLSLEELKKPHFINREFNGKLIVGDEILVQVIKEAMKTKEPVVTTNLSFAGKYAILTMGNRGISFSGKLTSSVSKNINMYLKKTGIKESLENKTFGFIIRTNAGELDDYDVLLEEMKVLTATYKQTVKTAMHRTCFSCIVQSFPGYLKDIRDIYRNQYEKIVTDDQALYQNLKAYLETDPDGMPHPLQFYQDSMLPLGKLYSIETKLEEALGRRVWMKSGGYLIIEPTEALTVIDVNTGKYSGKKDIEDTFFLINKEAAEEIAIQLRVRNISGIIIVDFINMKSRENKEKLMDIFELYLKKDNIKTNIVDMTPLGLVEITRMKKSRSLYEQLKVQTSSSQDQTS